MLEIPGEHETLTTLLQEQLQQVQMLFQQQLASDLDPVNELCQHVEQYRGKMLRPTMVFLSGLAVKGARWSEQDLLEQHRVVAAVTEMIHMATLVHDDVLDDASVRRRGATVNHLHGNEMAVMLGDYLISNAFSLCSRLDEPWINSVLGNVTNTLCEGELVQLHHRDDLHLDRDTYFQIIRRKTAALIGVCCRLGSMISGADAVTGERMDRFGMGLGLAFQIQDDLLDLEGSQEVVGKSINRDLANGMMTLPLIIHMEQLGPEDRAEFSELIRTRDSGVLLEQLAQSGAMEAARNHAMDLVRSAKQDLEELEDSPARQMLHAAADAVIERSF